MGLYEDFRVMVDKLRQSKSRKNIKDESDYGRKR
jgi:hypothetical protein